VSVPVLVVTGFLGAGKTTFINDLLLAADGRRIAAIVNDFGAINIDAELIAGKAESVIGLKNGCVCCSLQGDLIRTLKIVMSQNPKPDHIVIEASGVAEPSGIVQALTDVVLWNSIRHDAVLCVVDAEDINDNPRRRQDDLWQAQMAAADFLALAKTAKMAPDLVAGLRLSLSPSGKPPVFDLCREKLATDILFSDMPRRARPSPALRVGAGRFASLEWHSPGSVSLHEFQKVIEELAPMLVRAKGLLSFAEKPGQSYLLQMVGMRATLAPAQQSSEGCRLVLIGEADAFDPRRARARLSEIPAEV